MTWLEFLVFGWKYTSFNTARKKKRVPEKVNSIHYVVHEGTKDWILGAKARRLSKYSNRDASVFYSTKFNDLKPADAYFFLHPNLYIKSLQRNAWLKHCKCIVMFTHPEFKNKFSIKHRVYVLNKAHKVIFLNREHADLMVHHGLIKSKVEIMHLASDSDMFLPHDRTNAKVCVSMAYYKRKNPYLLFEIVKKMPHRNFLLIGKKWEQFEHWAKLKELANFEYHEGILYENYPKLYAQCDVFLSSSYLEGGPVPLLETMLCNMVPVASKTGYCTDIIKHGENGFLFDTNASADDVIPLIDKAYTLPVNTRESVIDFTWEKYGTKIDELFDMRE
ncbi:glycosyltransferase family 4 protein [Labilibacter sediminis]|nr:glycosyltransferase family 4 protein [Labilibacter sediminis]